MKYPSSKWSIADWIISCFPQYHSYLEPFYGSGAVLFNKPRSNIETVNDLDAYVLSTQHGKQYRYEMDNGAQSDLLETLHAHEGPILISGYDSELYNDSLHGWYRVETDCYSQTASKKREVLWMNFKPAEQMSIADFPEITPKG